MKKNFVTRYFAHLLLTLALISTGFAEESQLSDEARFSQALERDVKAHFDCDHVTIEMLRRGPTQVGVALPKYYLWVIANESGKVSGQGAMRVACVDNQSFEVLQYFTVEQIENDPRLVSQFFPKALVPRIMELVGEARNS